LDRGFNVQHERSWFSATAQSTGRKLSALHLLIPFFASCFLLLDFWIPLCKGEWKKQKKGSGTVNDLLQFEPEFTYRVENGELNLSVPLPSRPDRLGDRENSAQIRISG
jgi:hypothetical protein